MWPHRVVLASVLAYSACLADPLPGQGISFTLEEATVQDINEAFDTGLLTSERLVQLYLNRIAAYDDQGPALNSIITLNPQAMATAVALDAERRTTGPRSVLHGVPVLLKDQLDTFDMPTTSGSLSLRDSVPPDDAFIVRKLRDAGAVILGKANLDEFACCSITRSSYGGQTRNPYDITRVPGGSSGGTAAAIAANFAVVGTGSDWWGSIQLPSSLNSLVGFMPTRMLVSSDGAVPPSSARRGVIGPMARAVADAAAMLDIIAGEDPADPITAGSGGHIPASYLNFLDPNGLQSARIGFVNNFLSGASLEVRNRALAARDLMTSRGASVVEINISMPSNDSTFYLDLEYGMNRYLESLGPNAPFHTLQEIIASGQYLPSLNSYPFCCLNGDIPPENDPAYAVVVAIRQALEQQVLAIMDQQNLDALFFPPLLSNPPDVRTLLTLWESPADNRNLNLAPFLGFPSITLPAEPRASGLPLGVSFVGRAFSEPTLIKLAYSFEQATHYRRAPTSTRALPGETITADFNGDGILDELDADALVAEIAGLTNDGLFDMTGDGLVDHADLTRWLAVAGATIFPSGNPVLYGDANLDGVVDSSDFLTWDAHKFTMLAAWTAGDFNADGFVDGSDFGIWNSNKFRSSDRASALPEPGIGLLCMMTLLLRPFRRVWSDLYPERYKMLTCVDVQRPRLRKRNSDTQKLAAQGVVDAETSARWGACCHSEFGGT